MKVLVACEESQAVTIELRKLGHNAFSCDIMECSGGHPEWHIKGDVTPILNGWCIFVTMDGEWHQLQGTWDMIIAHPPCTYLTITGNRWFNVERYGEEAIRRHQLREEAIAFFKEIAEADCPRIAIENPVGVISSRYRKPEQIIQPWQFAICEDDLTEKTTCLWLKGLPNLEPVNKESRRSRIMNGKHRTEEKSGKLCGITKQGVCRMRNVRWRQAKLFRELQRLWRNNGAVYARSNKMNDFYNAEYLSERVAALAKERDDIKSKLKDREAFHESCQRVANKELNRLRAERDYLYDLVEGTCTACKHNGVPEWPCHRCGDDEDLWEYGWEWDYD